NGNFQSQIIDSSELEISKRWIGASDFNNDNCQDIISSCSIQRHKTLFESMFSITNNCWLAFKCIISIYTKEFICLYNNQIDGPSAFDAPDIM
ncbi:unnamed protein product, partial [Adineta steineri]